MVGNINWPRFRIVSEEIFQDATIDNSSWGFQIQKGTKWNKGLETKEIEALEDTFALKLPNDYAEMLRHLNGFDTLHISWKGYI